MDLITISQNNELVRQGIANREKVPTNLVKFPKYNSEYIQAIMPNGLRSNAFSDDMYVLTTIIRFKREGIWWNTLVKETLYLRKETKVADAFNSINNLTARFIKNCYVHIYAVIPNVTHIDGQTDLPMFWVDEDQRDEEQRVKEDLILKP